MGKMKSRSHQERDSKNFDESNLYVPRNTELETEFIKNLIVSSRLMRFCYGIVKPSDLMEEGIRVVYKTMIRLYEAKQRWSSVVLKSNVREQEVYEDLFDDLEDPLDDDVFEGLVKSLKTASARRKIYSFLFQKFNGIWEEDPIGVSAEAIHFFTNMDMKLTRRDAKNLKPAIRSHLEVMKNRFAGKKDGVPTGFEALDFMLGQGLKRQEVIVPAAHTGIGKTSFSTTVAYNAAAKGFNVLYVTIEMGAESIIDKLVSFHTNIPITMIMQGKIKEERLRKSYDYLKSLPLTIQFMPVATPAEIHSLASKHKYTHGLDLLIIDYLGLVAERVEGMNDVGKFSTALKALKSTANILNCAVFTPHQLNRQSVHRSKDQKDPLLSDLRGSGTIEEDAAVVMFLIRNMSGLGSEDVKVRIAKNRYGQVGKVDLKFDKFTTRFLP